MGLCITIEAVLREVGGREIKTGDILIIDVRMKTS